MGDHGGPVRSRRALLGSVIGTLVGMVGTSIARPDRTRAADGSALIIGQANTASTQTRLTGQAPISGDPLTLIQETENGEYTGTSLRVENHQRNGVAVVGIATRLPGDFNPGIGGVFETWGDGVGVRVAGGTYGIDVSARHAEGIGIQTAGALTGLRASGTVSGATCLTYDGAALAATARYTGTGVVGQSGVDDESVRAAPRTGVYGFAAHDHEARGAVGESPAGVGVEGRSDTGIGVRAVSSDGVALAVEGVVQFDNAGVVEILPGARSVAVAPPSGLRPHSIVLATLYSATGRGPAVHFVHRNPAKASFTIWLTSAATRTVEIGWLVIG